MIFYPATTHATSKSIICTSNLQIKHDFCVEFFAYKIQFKIEHVQFHFAQLKLISSDKDMRI